MFKQYEMELAGRTLRVDIGRVCEQEELQNLQMVMQLFTMETQL